MRLLGKAFLCSIVAAVLLLIQSVSASAQTADLAITKTDGVTTVTAGGSTTYTITASNAGPNPATAVVSDTFPAVLTGTWTCVGAGGGTCTASGSGNINDTVNLSAGSSVTYTVTASISASASGTLSNTATVSSGVFDPNPANNSATDTDTIVGSADLAITKTDGVTTVTAGGSTTYTITASNAGPSNAAGATVADTLPASLTGTWTCVGAGGGTCTASGSGNINDTVNLPAGGSVTYTVSASISGSASGSLSNTATVTAPGGITDPSPGNNSATDTDTVANAADLAITKTDGVTSVTAGGSTTYTITASNAGPSSATGATVADILPAALTGATWTCVGAGGGTCTASGTGNINDTVNLPAGGSVTYTVSASISPTASGTLSNTATVTAPGGVTDPTPGNNSATDTDTVSAVQADLSITKTDGTSNVTASGTTTYTIVASNAGPNAARGATVTDALPAALTNATWTCVGAGGGTCTASGSGSISDTVSLPAGGSITYTLVATISASASGTLSNTATVTVPAGVTDPNPGNNSATDSDTVTGSTTTTLTSSSNPSRFGDPVTFTATVTSGSGAPTGTVAFKDGAAVIGTAALAGGTASFTTSALTRGSHSITASYGGAGGFTPSGSAVLQQAVDDPLDSLKLRAMQVIAAPVVAQVSGQAISGAMTGALNEAFGGSNSFVTMNGGGVRFNFAADPSDVEEGRAGARTDAGLPSRAAAFSADSPARSSTSPSARVGNAFDALAYAAPGKAPPLRRNSSDWFGWAEVRGAVLDHWYAPALGAPAAAPTLYGNQVNLLAGLTWKATPVLAVGALGGFETFDYRSDALQGRLKGDGWTVGSYLGWLVAANLRLDAGVAYSGIGYDGSAGLAAANFSGHRLLATGGLTGTYEAMRWQIEPSLRVYALWEHEDAYTDTLGTQQAGRNFSTGRASAGAKVAYPFAISPGTEIAPYVGVYGDYYFNRDDAAQILALGPLPTIYVLDGWSARALGGVTARFANGGQFALGAERAGLGGNFGLWTYRARASIPFGAQ
ncbi:Ig-like domain repeat protein [Bradyrhizobium genosp. A]|uniref:Ig-like domain repeat protein n=1 Tax=Bradyrhizobium genosp. A TaxID=83626 RepID=UPI003CEB252E